MEGAWPVREHLTVMTWPEGGQELFSAEVTCQLRPKGLAVINWAKRKSERLTVAEESPVGGSAVCSARPVWWVM